MTSTRREFLGSLRAPFAAGALAPLVGNSEAAGGWLEAREAFSAHSADPPKAAGDEALWRHAQDAFTVDRTYVNLNNGGVSPSPRLVQEATRRLMEHANSAPTAMVLLNEYPSRRETVRSRIAAHWGVSPEEIAITRNASESLQICQQGFDLSPGDEVLTSSHDYPRMITTFTQRERRDGIFLRQVKLPVPCEHPDLIVRRFEEAITDRTRLMLISHIVNITGQILPVKAIVEMARTRNGGIPVIVDGAHALAHFAFKLSDLGCDYYGVSLHKWLFAPHGSGLLYVRREKIPGLWPLMAAPAALTEDIRKFEEIGTSSMAPALATGEALTFHQMLGDERKEHRLRFLRDTWAKRLLQSGNGRVRLHTSLDPRFGCAIGVFEVDGIPSDELSKWLFAAHRIVTVNVGVAGEFSGIRVTPNVYTTMEELDRFCDAVEWAMEKGLPAPKSS
jgi:selenocysteine lyase/cysteine desulfurase